MSLTQAHNDYLDPDRHGGSHEMPEEAPNSFTIEVAMRHGSFVVTCPEWKAELPASTETVAETVRSLVTEIVDFGQENGWAEYRPKPPARAPLSLAPAPGTLRDCRAKLAMAEELLDRTPGDEQDARDVALGLALQACKILVAQVEVAKTQARASAPA